MNPDRTDLIRRAQRGDSMRVICQASDSAASTVVRVCRAHGVEPPEILKVTKDDAVSILLSNKGLRQTAINWGVTSVVVRGIILGKFKALPEKYRGRADLSANEVCRLRAFWVSDPGGVHALLVAAIASGELRRDITRGRRPLTEHPRLRLARDMCFEMGVVGQEPNVAACWAMATACQCSYYAIWEISSWLETMRHRHGPGYDPRTAHIGERADSLVPEAEAVHRGAPLSLALLDPAERATLEYLWRRDTESWEGMWCEFDEWYIRGHAEGHAIAGVVGLDKFRYPSGEDETTWHWAKPIPLARLKGLYRADSWGRIIGPCRKALKPRLHGRRPIVMLFGLRERVDLLVCLAWHGQPIGLNDHVIHVEGRQRDCRPRYISWGLAIEDV